MKIYAIFVIDESYEDHEYWLDENHVYMDRDKAEEICNTLNNPIFITPSEEQWNKDKEHFDESFTYEDYVKYYKEVFERNSYTYFVKELNVQNIKNNHEK